MTKRVCLLERCSADISHKNPRAKFCNRSHKAEHHNLQTGRNKGSYRQEYYRSRTVPRGQRLQQLLDGLFRSQAAQDPSGLPQLASRVLSWSPKGYASEVQYAFHPHGPLERDWLYYAEMSPEEAVVVYERED